MKKTILAIAAAVMMSVSMMAQEQQQGRQPRQFNKEEMIKNRTEQTVKDYGLNDEQAAKLLTLNTEYFDKLPMMGRGQRGGGPRGERPQAGRQRPQHPDSARQGIPGGERGQRPQWNREEMQKNMEAYNGELKKIMTDEQYAKYQADQEKRMKEGPTGRRGQRPQRNNNNNN